MMREVALVPQINSGRYSLDGCRRLSDLRWLKTQPKEDSDEIRRWICLTRTEEKPAGPPPHGTEGGKIWREHGALEYRECVGDDLSVKFGVPFPRMIKLKPGETVIFAWVVFKSRAHRDRVNAKVMKDPRITNSCDPKSMPFDVKRMVYGGFKILVDA